MLYIVSAEMYIGEINAESEKEAIAIFIEECPYADKEEIECTPDLLDDDWAMFDDEFLED